MFSILKKELNCFFANTTGYIVIGIFLLLNGLLLWVIPGEYNILDSGYANTDGLFYLAPWIFLFLCPAITMRIFSEEKQSGTWELIRTRPISNTSIVLGKFLAIWLVAGLALLPTLIYFVSVWQLAEPLGNVDGGGFWGAFLGLFFLATIYCSIGIFTSAISKNQIVSFVAALFICLFFYYGFEIISDFLPENMRLFTENMGINAHYKSISRGVLDSYDIGYTLVISLIFILTTIRIIKK